MGSEVSTMSGPQQLLRSSSNLKICPWNQINERGFYVDLQTGKGYRFQNESLSAGHSPTVTSVSDAPQKLVKLSDNPFLTVSDARVIAADNDVTSAF